MQENACVTIYLRNTRGKSLVEERDALSEVGRKLRREIANGKVAGKGQAWLDHKTAKLLEVGSKWAEVNSLILDGHVTRQRAQGSDNDLGTKNILHFGA